MLNTMMTETFGRRLKRLRLARGISQRKLAAAVGLTNGAISQAEDGKLWVDQLPSYDIVKRLASALGVTTASLAGDDPEGAAGSPDPAEPPAVEDHAMRVIPAPWFDLVEILSRDEEFRATAEQIMELRRTQTPRVAQQAEEQLLGAWRKNAEMWRTIWALAQEAAREQMARRESELLARDEQE